MNWNDLFKIQPAEEWHKKIQETMDHIVLESHADADRERIEKHYSTLIYIRKLFDVQINQSVN
jgi:hypothetical protein